MALSRAERRARVVELHDEGLQLREIAAQVGVSHETVRTDLRDAGVSTRTVRPPTPTTTSTAVARRVVEGTVEPVGDDRAPARRPPRPPQTAVRVPRLLAELFGIGPRGRRQSDGPPCDDCADARIREPSGYFPPAIARDRDTGRALCDYHARERHGRLHPRELAPLPNQSPPPPGQWQAIMPYPREQRPGQAEALPAWRNDVVDLSGWYG